MGAGTDTGQTLKLLNHRFGAVWVATIYVMQTFLNYPNPKSERSGIIYLWVRFQ